MLMITGLNILFSLTNAGKEQPVLPATASGDSAEKCRRHAGERPERCHQRAGGRVQTGQRAQWQGKTR